MDSLFDSAQWFNRPVSATRTDSGMDVEAVEGSDLWRTTYYDFVHDDGHALLAPLAINSAVEVGFIADFAGQFDQAGVLARADASRWVKAGVEIVDGLANLGVVATRELSDWSSRPAPEVRSQLVTMRLSRSRDALTVRARIADGAWEFLRVTPVDPEVELAAGPYVCAPTRAGLRVRFLRFAMTSADTELHG